MEAGMVPKSGAAPTKPSTVDMPPLVQQLAGMTAPHNKVTLDATCRGNLVGGVLTGAANKSHDMLGMDTGFETWTGSPVPFGYRVRRCFSVVGVAVTSTAATALAAGTPTPAIGFALFVLLLGGLSLVSLGVVGGATSRGCSGEWDDDISLHEHGLRLMKVHYASS